MSMWVSESITTILFQLVSLYGTGTSVLELPMQSLTCLGLTEIELYPLEKSIYYLKVYLLTEMCLGGGD